jgi:hypothetical protein
VKNNRTLREIEHSLGRLVNVQKAAEGTILPPRQAGANRVQPVSNLRLARTLGITGGTEFTLFWNDVQAVPPASYVVYPFLVINQNSVKTLPEQSVNRSPATIRVMADADEIVIFKVQTIMGGGLASIIDNSPSCTGVTV